jgi:hypothetical protein
MSKKTLLWLCLGAVAVAAQLPIGASSPPATMDGKAAFEQMKSLAGTWEGTAPAMEGHPAAPVEVRYAVTSGGNAVAETLFAGTPHEMLSVYTLRGDDLVLTHFCASGHHPEMKLDRTASKDGDLDFVFTRALNFDPATDEHIHGAHFTLKDGRLTHVWSSYKGGKPSPDKLMVALTRAGG